MRIFDVTRLIHHAVPVYEGDPEVSIAPWLSIARGSPVNVSRLSMGSHTGTHVDAPAHLREGAPGVDQLPLDVLIGPARVVDLTAGKSCSVVLDPGSAYSHRDTVVDRSQAGRLAPR